MRIKAIVLKKIPIKEHDALIVCYTQDAGKQVYHAKSILRHTSKQASHLDVLNYVEFSLADSKSMPIIISSVCIEAFRLLKSSLPALAAAYFLLECFDKLIFEGESDLQLWDFLYSRLTRLNSMPLDMTEAITCVDTMQADLFEIMGYQRDTPRETLVPMHFNSLQFLKNVVK